MITLDTTERREFPHEGKIQFSTSLRERYETLETERERYHRDFIF